MTAMVGYEVYRTAAAAGVKVVLGGDRARTKPPPDIRPTFDCSGGNSLATGAWGRLTREISAVLRGPTAAGLDLLRGTRSGHSAALCGTYHPIAAGPSARNAARLRVEPVVHRRT